MAASIKICEFVMIPVKSKFSDSGEDGNKHKDIPEKRSGHRIVVNQTNLYSLGGYNPDLEEMEDDEDSIYPLFRELWKFNFATERWKRMKIDSFMPFELASHSVVRDRSNLLMFGGTSVPFGETNSNDLNVCDLKTAKWKCYSCSGDLPDKKYGHSMTLVDNCVYIIGGTTGYVYNMDVHLLDLQTLHWQQLAGHDKSLWEPSSRYRHEVISKGFELYLFGGGTAIQAFDLEKIPVFDTVLLQWKEILTNADEVNGFPSPRKCHSCVSLQDDVFICGGLADSNIVGDIWRLNLQTFNWTKFKACLPAPVYFHSADVTQCGCMYIFGGVVKIDNERSNNMYKIWLRIPPLKELCWSIMCSTMLDKNIDIKELANLGVPSDCIERIDGL